MKELIQRSLDICGYGHMEPTKENLIECFLDYIDHGIFGNLSTEEALDEIEDGTITVEIMCKNLLKLR